MSRNSARSSLDNKNQQLPGLSGKKKRVFNPNAINDEINNLKLQTSKMQTESRVLRSKTTRLNQVLRDRNNQIKSALTKPIENQNIVTATDSAISMLEENIEALQHTLDARENELEELRNNDKLAVSDELQVEVLEYCCEFERLKQQVAIVHDGETVVQGELDRLSRFLSYVPINEKAISDMQFEIDQLADKLSAYRLGEMRLDAQNDVQNLIKQPELYPSLKEKLEKEVKKIQEAKAQVEEDIKTILENDEKNREYLQKIIDDQAIKITEAIEAQNDEIKASKMPHPLDEHKIVTARSQRSPKSSRGYPRKTAKKGYNSPKSPPLSPK